MISYVLPALFRKFNSKSNDVKFLSLKIFSDLIITYINDSSIFDLGNTKEKKYYTTKKLNDMIVNYLLPNQLRIFAQPDPNPLFGLKLFSAVTARNHMYVEIADNLQIYDQIMEYYQIGHKLNRHTIKIVKNFIDCPSIPLETIVKFRLTETTIEMIDSMIDERQEWCFELLLSALSSLINKVDLAHQDAQIHRLEDVEYDIDTEIRKILNCQFSCLELLNMENETEVIERAASCLLQVLKKFGSFMDKETSYISEEGFEMMMACLKLSNVAIKMKVKNVLNWYLTNSGK